ncbi:MAG: DUF4437 domain-containing protein [Acidobacteria bacterium]|nr:DUF4437 domain-containing protein [Acidobacteriota bacterium]
MSIKEKSKSRIRRRVAIATTCVLLGVAAGILAETPAQNIVTSFEEVKFPPPKPLGNSTATSAFLWSDPVTGANRALVKFTKGSTNRHYHTYDYQCVVVKGPVTHWTEKIPEAGAKQLGPGSYWYQPKGQVHQDTCLTDECVLFVDNFSRGETIDASAKK